MAGRFPEGHKHGQHKINRNSDDVKPPKIKTETFTCNHKSRCGTIEKHYRKQLAKCRHVPTCLTYEQHRDVATVNRLQCEEQAKDLEAFTCTHRVKCADRASHINLNRSGPNCRHRPKCATLAEHEEFIARNSRYFS